jgi:hypothetical protein
MRMMSEESSGVPEGEEYWDPVQKRMRRRRGHGKPKRGPWSVAEIGCSRQFKYFIASMHYMHPELADTTAGDMTVLLARAQVICERYPYADFPDVTGLDLHIVRNELDLFAEPPPDDDTDIYKGLS